MSVTFDGEGKFTSRRRKQNSGLLQLVIRWGFAKNEQQATVVLGVVALLLFVVASILLFNGANTPKGPTPEELQILQRQEQRL